MKKMHFFSPMFFLSFFIALISFGCVATPPVVKISESPPSIIREYKHLAIYGTRPGMINTGINLNEGDVYTILAEGTINLSERYSRKVGPSERLMAKIGKNSYFGAFSIGVRVGTRVSNFSGNLYLGMSESGLNKDGSARFPRRYEDNSGFFRVDVIVWSKEDYIAIADFLKEMKDADPENQTLVDAFAEVRRIRDLSVAQAKASKEIEKTKIALEKLQLASGPDKPLKSPKPQAPPEITEVKAPPKEPMTQVESKLAALANTLADLENLKKQLEDEKKKSQFLSKALEEKEKKEKDLLAKLKEESKAVPVIMIASPRDKLKVESETIRLTGVAEDQKGLAKVEIFINDRPVIKEKGRGFRIVEQEKPKRLDFNETIRLEKGLNRIKFHVLNTDGFSAEKLVTVYSVEKRSHIWAVIVGIDDYPNIRPLKYAVNDAELFHNYLTDHSNVPKENVTLLLNKHATLNRLRSALGTHLKNKAGKDDMVIIYFAGHGATERDMMSPDGDGLEKYLLPYDADSKDLYASSLPMREISHIFNRIRSERLVFIADSCYSGASGGRTIGIGGIRANISEAFMDRIAGGKGRVIISASGANEVSAENDDLKHGVFTYYLVEGLKGKADFDQDGLISVDEVYRFVSENVPKATGQEQHPIKKGTVEGRLILGVTK